VYRAGAAIQVEVLRTETPQKMNYPATPDQTARIKKIATTMTTSETSFSTE